jgi:hypothetical protein
LFPIPYMQNLSTSHANIEVINIFEDDQVLLKSANGWTRKLILYNYRSGTFQFTQFQNTYEVCVESLISPCS